MDAVHTVTFDTVDTNPDARTAATTAHKDELQTVRLRSAHVCAHVGAYVACRMCAREPLVAGPARPTCSVMLPSDWHRPPTQHTHQHTRPVVVAGLIQHIIIHNRGRVVVTCAAHVCVCGVRWFCANICSCFCHWRSSINHTHSAPAKFYCAAPCLVGLLFGAWGLHSSASVLVVSACTYSRSTAVSSDTRSKRALASSHTQVSDEVRPRPVRWHN